MLTCKSIGTNPFSCEVSISLSASPTVSSPPPRIRFCAFDVAVSLPSDELRVLGLPPDPSRVLALLPELAPDDITDAFIKDFSRLDKSIESPLVLVDGSTIDWSLKAPTNSFPSGQTSTSRKSNMVHLSSSSACLALLFAKPHFFARAPLRLADEVIANASSQSLTAPPFSPL